MARLSVEAWLDRVDMFSWGRTLVGGLLSFDGASLSQRLEGSLPLDRREVERRRRLDLNSLKEDKEESLR